MVAFLRDRKGATTVQFLLLLPLLLVIAVGSFELWKILYVRQTLNDAAYQGARLLAMQPNHDRVSVEVDKLIRRYVTRNAFVDPALKQNPDNDSLLQVVLEYDPPRCGDPIVVTVRLYWLVGREWGFHRWLPFVGQNGYLEARSEGWVLCERDSDVYGP